MSKPTGGLGRGLGALIPQQPVQTQTPEGKTETIDVASSLRILDVAPDAISENPHQPRKEFSPSELEDLLASIKEHGILQPLVVTEKGEGEYELIAGERRLRASRMLGLDAVPVVVREQASDQEKLELALIENIQRQQLSPVEEARAYEGLADLFGLTQSQIAQRVGKSRSFVANTMRLLELDEEILQALSDTKITRSHARTLLAEPDIAKRKELFDQMLSGNMTVRQAEAKTGYGKKKKSSGGKDPNVVALEDELRDALGTKVAIDMKNGSGKVTLHFYSKDELKALIQKLTG